MFGRHARHRLAAYCDGELAWPQARMVEAHLRNCAACRALCDEIRTGAQWADGMHRVSPPDELWEAVAREIGKPRRPDRPRGATPGRLPLWSAAAAIAAAALGLETADGPRSYSYFSPSYPRQPRGVTLEWYSDTEQRSAIARLPAGQRELLERIWRVTDEPLVVSESRSNRALIENPGSVTNAVVRREVSLVGGTEQTDKVFRVRVVYPQAPSVDWSSDGTMTWSTARVETICSIDARSHLASKYDSQALRADGGRLAYLQELELLRAEWPTADLAQMFRQSPPPATPTPPLTPHPHLSGYAREAQASWPR